MSQGPHLILLIILYMIDHYRLKWVWILMISRCSRVLHQLQRQTFLWDRFLPCTTEASHLYLRHCFFLKGGTLFCILGSASSSEQFLFGILLLGGSLFCLSSSHHSLLYILDVCHNGGVLITPSIHASSFISLFGGGFFPWGFPSFPTLWEMCICIVNGYLKWPCS